MCPALEKPIVYIRRLENLSDSRLTEKSIALGQPAIAGPVKGLFERHVNLNFCRECAFNFYPRQLRNLAAVS